MTLNPDFRGADEVEVPGNLADLCGWIPNPQKERRLFGQMEDETPQLMRTRATIEIPQAIRAAWDDFQLTKGRFAGSNDMTLLDEFVYKKNFAWLPQIGGTCVESNGLRPWTKRALWQVNMEKQGMEHLGLNEFGIENLSHYGPYSYGDGRRRGGLRGSDGSYCSIQMKSWTTGVILCNQPELVSLLTQLGVAGDRDFPEPQGSDGLRVYRKFGNWSYLDELAPYATCPLLEAPSITNAEQLWGWMLAGKTAISCSNIAIRKIGTHRDGFALHGPDPRNSWAHNMSWQGAFITSNGDRICRLSNESWHPDYIYNIPFEVLESIIGRLTIGGIGQIDLPKSDAPAV